MMYSCHGLMLARQMCACVAEGARAHGLPHLVIFSLSTILSALPSLPAISRGGCGREAGSRETPRTLARGGYEGSATTQFRPYTTRSLCSVITAGRWLRSRARSGRREMSRSRVSALSGVARWAAHLLLVGLALPALAVHAGTRMPPVSDGSLRLRGGAQELKIEHRAFVANLPKTITDKGLREAFAPFGKIKQARVLKDIETGQSRRMGYVTFEDGHALTEAIEDMHEAEFCTTQVQEGEGKPEICTKLHVSEAKPEKQTW